MERIVFVTFLDEDFLVYQLVFELNFRRVSQTITSRLSIEMFYQNTSRHRRLRRHIRRIERTAIFTTMLLLKAVPIMNSRSKLQHNSVKSTPLNRSLLIHVPLKYALSQTKNWSERSRMLLDVLEMLIWKFATILMTVMRLYTQHNWSIGSPWSSEPP